ncbi:hypothetical protein F3Y22_tig00018568pilonHSYRG00009 [Hibiscus syriacus]|uniref:Uncharacterized protein n=1 Tax=Hibiscus syriacus TaxID=106335 RepID=A0A6A3C0N2_HIBSY|nr:hypothetical protein F3Y22_tig00018568pilonHSYRG00009 [Hibiscus syriacus]
MQQGDQMVLSLRPGGGRGNRLFSGPSSSSSSLLAFGSFFLIFLPFIPMAVLLPRFLLRLETQDLRIVNVCGILGTRFYSLGRVVEVAEEILKIKRDIEVEIFGEDQNWRGPVPALIKAEVPWSARRGNLSEKDRVLKTVKG